MTQKEHLLEMFRIGGGRLTLRFLLQTSLAAEYRARMTDLRKEGHRITWTRGRHPGDNLYTLEKKENLS
jgi:hypothetical protein